MGAIYLIRHGQASAGKSDYDQLSPQGIEQAAVLGAALRVRVGTPDAVVCGAMKRHRETAEHSLVAMGLAPEWDTDICWNEYDHQELIVRHKPAYANRAIMIADLARTLKPREAFQSMFEDALGRWTGGDYDHEYQETWGGFRKRVDEGLDRLIDTARSRTTLVYTSGGAISATVMRLWGLPDSAWPRLNRVIANATVTKVVVGRRGPVLSTFNEHSHFEGAHQALLTYR